MGALRVGKPDVAPDASSHIDRVQTGNAGPFYKQPGHKKDGKADARRSTGVQPKRHDAILPIMPNLPPG